ncbi:heavy metal-associated domain-containing protein [Clostridium sp. AWRP]|uniref:heavy-metal-associated domain-containing protein n=1 Tax=Clostridium sp. AWRP TaxID=2212991 RepID=UPI000FD9D1EC|nr:heavy metal-associated domain-containing protein [Clostridium sp. AWRP]AZV59109.1 heavy-metal-associated domain-containing protein [Clostridium sp. AWRP]
MFFKSKIKKIVHVEGMSCSHCVDHVKSALESVDGISSVKVDLNSKTAVVKCLQEINNSDIEAAVKDAGYEVTSIEEG